MKTCTPNPSRHRTRFAWARAMFLADFHVHTQFSDGKLTLPEVVDLYGRRGFGAIAITDHVCEQGTLIGKFARLIGHTLTPENFETYLNEIQKEAERAWNLYRMVVIPGCELSRNSPSNHRSAHILALGLSRFVPADGEILKVIRSVRAAGAVAIAAHPVPTRKFEKQTYQLWDMRDELRHEFDAWEVASGPYIFEEVRESGLPMIASSDLHVSAQMTSWKTVLECERHPEAILDAIRRQELSFQFYRDSTPSTTERCDPSSAPQSACPASAH